MALISLRLLRDYAAEHFFAFSAFNANNLKQMQAIRQADACDSPILIQDSAGATKYPGEPFSGHLNPVIESYPHTPIVMHQEHGKSAAICDRAIQSGFSSVMMNGHCFNINKYTKGDYA